MQPPHLNLSAAPERKKTGILSLNVKELKVHSQVWTIFGAESPLNMMKNAFYFTLKARLVLKIFNFFSCLFGDVEKRFDWKDKVNFKNYDVATWETNNCNAHITQYLKK